MKSSSFLKVRLELVEVADGRESVAKMTPVDTIRIAIYGPLLHYGGC